MLEFLTNVRFCGAYQYCGQVSQHHVIPMSHLLCKVGGSTCYRQGKHTFTTHPGDLALIPKGAEFEATILEPGTYIILYFESEKPLPTRLRHYPGAADTGISGAFFSALSAWNSRDSTSFFFCQARLYEVLGHLAAYLQNRSVPLSEQKKIADAVDYLRSHLSDPNFSMAELYTRANISETYFRQIFRKLYGMPPKRYLVRARISRAEGLLLSEPSCRIQEVAAAVGYTDVYLFSRTFRRETGVSPSRYAERFLA